MEEIKDRMELVLPIGFMHNDTWYRNFELLPVDEAVERVIHNDTLRRNHPQLWIKQVVAGLLNNIEGESIGWEARDSNFKKIPPIVNRIPLPDAGYILVAGHRNEFGDIIEDVEQKCIKCGKGFKTDLNISRAEVEFADQPIEEFPVDLEDGFIRKSEGGKDKLGFEDVPFNRYTFRVPTIGDGIKHERFFSQADRITFNMKIIQECLLKVEAVDGDNVSLELEKKYREMYGSQLFSKLRGKDRTKIRKVFGELPSIEMKYEEICSNCGEDTPVVLDPSYFFPVG